MLVACLFVCLFVCSCICAIYVVLLLFFLMFAFFYSKKFVFFLKISVPQDLTQNDFGHGGMTLAQAPARFRLKTSPGELDPYR